MLPSPDVPGTDLPVRRVLPDLRAALAGDGAVVLVAPPGTGKTTLVPLALAGDLPGRILVAEPRRVAARAAARRMASLLGEEVGERVGYAVRGDRTVGPRTRVEVVTTGLLVARLQADNGLTGVSAVVVDECHERHLDTDLAVAFLHDVRSVLRPELELVATSATAEADRLAAALGAAPVVRSDGGLHEVAVVWAPPPMTVPPSYGLRVDPRLLGHVATVVRRALAEAPGDLLVFLPGAGEIATVAAALHGVPATVVTLHGRLTAAEQDRALTATADRRVVLTTAVAESSLTVPGVRIVVDAGLSREPRTDLSRGLDALVTVTASRAAATQRAGRAGREGPGRVYRCWTETEHARRPAFPQPEVATADLTAFALQLACWGAPGGVGLALLDPPPAGAWQVATEVLGSLGAIGHDGRATPRGQALRTVGSHPRLARALLDGAQLVGARAAAEVVALLDEAGVGDGDLDEAWHAATRGRPPTVGWAAEVRRLERALRGAGVTRTVGTPRGARTAGAAGIVAGLAFPERLARRRPGGSDYLMVGGTGATLPPRSPLTGSPWLAVATADRQPGRREARIRLAATVDEATARTAGAALLVVEDSVRWADGDVRAERVTRLGAIVLGTAPLDDPDPAAVSAAVADGVRAEGLAVLRWTTGAQALRRRLAACHAGLGAPWPDVSEAALLEGLLAGPMAAARSRRELQRIDVAGALRALVPYSVAGRLDELAPERRTVPSGSSVAVDYTDPESPLLAVKLQEMFGATTTPLVAGRPVLLHLLDPAGRPVAVTRDLPSFWATGYPEVRAALRGRYPRHPWPEDPLTEPPTRRVKPRR